MSLQNSTLGPKVCEVVGQMAPIAFGIQTASGTDLTVTIPQFSHCYGAWVGSTSTTTAGYVGTTSGNSFTAVVGNGEVCMYIAFGKVKG
jgi:hypothetical protein